MPKIRQETANDPALDGAADQLDIASVEMLHNYTDGGLRAFAEQCRHWQAMAVIELERRNQGNRTTQN